ncbi:TetR/AcrR family transcriptional regulator [Paenibacillus anseongense]|uniref:TetR/AcrR family transcriptional regulator n=1 Tax=Paenibacillus anseongense TaxID=2682845 RepID=UPI002DBBB6CC|nr:TetR/AcrR family transcriptional regulator [Paenibacillus anseongense]MEC0269258.1 TetR/AcrR family transcriptional regulator [Paenibacillus anseongense]
MPINANDPRVKRTRQLLMQSFMELLIEKKNIYSISVQDIAARATVNRATFYAHFEDKFAFLECWMREKFQKKLKEALPDSSISNMSSLRTLLLAVFDFLARTRQYMASEDRQFEPLFEIAMQKELYQLLFEWLSEEAESKVSLEIVQATSLVTSWGIFGSAVQWSRDPQNRTAEAMVQDVLVVVAAGLAPVMT